MAKNKVYNMNPNPRIFWEEFEDLEIKFKRRNYLNLG